MDHIGTMLKSFPPELVAKMSLNTEMSSEEREQRQCDAQNRTPGSLTGYDCPDCLNRGYVMTMRNGSPVAKECRCMDIRRSLKRIERSGLSDMLEDCTFDTFEAEKDWQKTIKQSAMNFCRDNHGKWFFVGGQVGAGKTHLCTAIVGQLLNDGRSARYMLWRNEATTLKAHVNDAEQYTRLIHPLKTVEVLYIDDFFKVPRGERGEVRRPTPGDINIAYEILNYRYNNRSLITIISSEHGIKALMDMDEAVGSRIYQRTKDFCNVIERDRGRNYRMVKP